MIINPTLNIRFFILLSFGWIFTGQYLFSSLFFMINNLMTKLPSISCKEMLPIQWRVTRAPLGWALHVHLLAWRRSRMHIVSLLQLHISETLIANNWAKNSNLFWQRWRFANSSTGLRPEFNQTLIARYGNYGWIPVTTDLLSPPKSLKLINQNFITNWESVCVKYLYLPRMRLYYKRWAASAVGGESILNDNTVISKSSQFPAYICRLTEYTEMNASSKTSWHLCANIYSQHGS